MLPIGNVKALDSSGSFFNGSGVGGAQCHGDTSQDRGELHDCMISIANFSLGDLTGNYIFVLEHSPAGAFALNTA